MFVINNRRTALTCLVLALGTALLYAPCLRFSFVNYDDQIYVVGNPWVVHGLSWLNLEWAFESNYTGNWHPVTWLSHMLDCQLWGLNPAGHHATNVVLHVINTVLLFLLIRRMTGAFWRSVIVAALFSWHPLRAESVAWVSERKDVLGGLFWLVASLAYVAYVEQSRANGSNRWRYYVVSVVMFSIGLMAKPIVVTLPLVLLLWDWWPLRRWGNSIEGGPDASIATPPVSLKVLLIEKIPFFCLAALSCLLTLLAQTGDRTWATDIPPPLPQRILTCLISYAHYLEKTIWPLDLGAFYPRPDHWPASSVLKAVLMLAVITGAALRWRRVRPYWLVGWVWFVGMLLPVTGLLHVGGQIMADRYTYLPSIALFLILCWDAEDLARDWRHARWIMGAVAAVMLAMCALLTHRQLACWRDTGSLFARIPDSSINYFAHANYAAYLMHQNQLAAAEDQSIEAVRISPGRGYLYALLGDIFVQEGKFSDAIATCRQALKLDPKLFPVRLPLGRALLAQHSVDAAIGEFAAVLKFTPDDPEAHFQMALALSAAGRPADALVHFRETVRLRPNSADALNALAWKLATDPHSQLRNASEAIQDAARACQLTHNADPTVLETMAAALAEGGRFTEAATAAEHARNLAIAHGQKDLAAKISQQLLLFHSRLPYHGD